jgi:hypothetical protein
VKVKGEAIISRDLKNGRLKLGDCLFFFCLLSEWCVSRLSRCGEAEAEAAAQTMVSPLVLILYIYV